MRLFKIFLPLAVSISLLSSSLALSDDACSGKPDTVIRLDSPHGTLENAKTLDQDSVGVCYATAMATTLQSALPNHPDVSYLDYAIQYKKAELENPNPKLNLASGSVLEGGSDPCKLFGNLKKNGLCPRSKVNLEMAAMSNPGLQVTALSGIGSFFDAQRNKTEAQKKEVLAAIQKSLQAAKGSAEKECSQFPTEMRRLLSDVFFNLKQRLSDLRVSQHEHVEVRGVEQAKLDDLLKRQADIKNKGDEYQRQRDLMKSNFDAEVKKKNPKEGSSWLADKTLKWQEADLDLQIKQNDLQMDMINLSSELRSQQSRVRQYSDEDSQIESYQKQMVLLGDEIPDPDAKLAGATRLKLSEDVENRLKGEYRESIAKSSPGLFDFSHYSNLASDFLTKIGIEVDPVLRRKLGDHNDAFALDKEQTNPSECLNSYLQRNSSDLRARLAKDMKSCSDPKLLDSSVQMLSILSTDANATINAEAVLLKMYKSPWAFLEDLIGSSCKPADRIKIPANLSCSTHNVIDEALNQEVTGKVKDAFDSAQMTSRVTGELRKDSLSSLSHGRAVTISVCADFLYSSSADSRYGLKCDSGHHAIDIIGYRCKAGHGAYLIQNSWGAAGSKTNPDYESDHGRNWIPENAMVRNLSSYSVLKGGSQ